ncbi:hypothetical protein BDZ91DRAFT_781252 [Kalaharituber pfeilii]|nr:hypothetical protein BDZ91DRAFT_781252 [Kalaharituber pfeilii]
MYWLLNTLTWVTIMKAKFLSLSASFRNKQLPFIRMWIKTIGYRQQLQLQAKYAVMVPICGHRRRESNCDKFRKLFVEQDCVLSDQQEDKQVSRRNTKQLIDLKQFSQWNGNNIAYLLVNGKGHIAKDEVRANVTFEFLQALTQHVGRIIGNSTKGSALQNKCSAQGSFYPGIVRYRSMKLFRSRIDTYLSGLITACLIDKPACNYDNTTTLSPLPSTAQPARFRTTIREDNNSMTTKTVQCGRAAGANS